MSGFMSMLASSRVEFDAIDDGDDDEDDWTDCLGMVAEDAALDVMLVLALEL